MGNMEREKGLRIEREIINLHKNLGVDAERVPLSGATRYQGGGHDVDIYAFGRHFKSEVKGRASGAGFTMLERWLSDYDVLFLRRDRQEPLVVLPWNTWVALLGANAPTTSTPPKPKNGRDGATCAKPATGREAARGDRNEHSDESRKGA